jgi:hypothetical protein
MEVNKHNAGNDNVSEQTVRVMITEVNKHNAGNDNLSEQTKCG